MSNVRELVNAGNDAADRGDHSLAAELFRAAIDLGANIGINLGNSLCELGDFDGAIAAYAKAWERGDEDAGFNLGRTYEDLGNEEKARLVYEVLVTRGYAKANVELAQLESARGEQKRAEELLLAVADEESEMGRAASGLLGLWYHQRSEPDEKVEPLLRRDLDFPSTRAEYGELMLRMRGEAAAISILEVGASRGEAESLIVLGNIHEDAGRIDEAKAAYLAGANAGDRNSAENLANLEQVGREGGRTST